MVSYKNDFQGLLTISKCRKEKIAGVIACSTHLLNVLLQKHGREIAHKNYILIYTKL